MAFAERRARGAGHGLRSTRRPPRSATVNPALPRHAGRAPTNRSTSPPRASTATTPTRAPHVVPAAASSTQAAYAPPLDMRPRAARAGPCRSGLKARTQGAALRAARRLQRSRAVGVRRRRRRRGRPRFGPLAPEGPERSSSSSPPARGARAARGPLTASRAATSRPVGEFSCRPDGAVIRAGLVGDVAHQCAGRSSTTIAYVTSDELHDEPVATAPRARHHAVGLKRLDVPARAGVGRLTIKPAARPSSPSRLRKQARPARRRRGLHRADPRRRAPAGARRGARLMASPRPSRCRSPGPGGPPSGSSGRCARRRRLRRPAAGRAGHLRHRPARRRHQAPAHPAAVCCSTPSKIASKACARRRPSRQAQAPTCAARSTESFAAAQAPAHQFMGGGTHRSRTGLQRRSPTKRWQRYATLIDRTQWIGPADAHLRRARARRHRGYRAKVLPLSRARCSCRLPAPAVAVPRVVAVLGCQRTAGTPPARCCSSRLPTWPAVPGSSGEVAISAVRRRHDAHGRHPTSSTGALGHPAVAAVQDQVRVADGATSLLEATAISALTHCFSSSTSRRCSTAARRCPPCRPGSRR